MTKSGGDLRLPPTAESAGAARRHVRALLAEAGHPGWADAAELAVSEVVTNCVLHAHTGLVLRVQVDERQALVEVEDGNPALPVQRTGQERSEDDASTTGRGLALLAAVTLARGVRSTDTGKVVWFTVGDEPEDQDEDALLAAFDDGGDWDLTDVDEPADVDAGTSVVLRDLPPTLWMAAREHHQALLRELVLFLAEHRDEVADPPDLTSVDAARSLVWRTLMGELDRGREQGSLRRPVPEGHPSKLPPAPPSLDLDLVVPADLGPAFSAMQDALDLAERLAVQDRLLVRPGLPEIVAVRDWVCEQVVAQLAGVPAAPWPGTDQARFTDLTHDRESPPRPDWDATVVTESDRGVVAADDANRIIAISPSLAALTGWKPDDLVGRRVVALIPPALREAHVAGFSRHLTTGEASVLDVPLELPVLHADGREIPCTFLVQRAEASGRPVYLAWIETLTD